MDNVRSAISNGQWLAREFEVNALEMACVALEKSLRSSRTQALDIVEMGLPLLDQAVGEENYEVLARLVKAIRSSITSPRLDGVRRSMAERVLAYAERAKREHDKLKSGLRALADDPDNAKANLAVGKYHCVLRDDWEEGLPLLVRGSDVAFQSLAKKDLTNPDDSASQIALGKAWNGQAGAANATRSLKVACQKRAYHWYQIAALELKGDKLKTVQQSMKALAKTVPELQSPGWQFGFYSGIIPGQDGSLRINPPSGMATRQYYRGPIDVTVVARSMTTDLNISIGAGGRLVFGYDGFKKINRLQVSRPDAAPESFGSLAVTKEVALPANRWFAVRWQVVQTGMKVWLDDRILFEEDREYALREKYLVKVHTNSEPVEVKSVCVQRGPAK